MTTITALINHQVRLARRPSGMPTREDWAFTTEPVPEPGPGGVLVKTLALSLDPAMRGWMNDAKSYIPPVGLGEVMRAGGIGKVIASQNPKFAVGDLVSADLGVQEYLLVAEDRIKRSGMFKIDSRLGSITQWLNVLGFPGMTAYFGLLDVGQPKPGETVVVSGAAGAVGQTVGQLAKIKGCRVVGIAGGSAKCDWVVRELGFDACIDYKQHKDAQSLSKALKEACPDGIDGYFENVGGMVMDAVMLRLNAHSRIALCGMIAGYDGQPVPMSYPQLLLTNRVRLQGFIVSEHMEDWPQALQELGTLVGTGKLRPRESVAQGLASAPEAFLGMLKGRNFGKQLVKVI
jgi:NADPH-dependent curcumin reductase